MREYDATAIRIQVQMLHADWARISSWWQAWEKHLIWNFNFKMCADFEPSNEGETNLWIAWASLQEI